MSECLECGMKKIREGESGSRKGWRKPNGKMRAKQSMNGF